MLVSTIALHKLERIEFHPPRGPLTVVLTTKIWYLQQQKCFVALLLSSRSAERTSDKDSLEVSADGSRQTNSSFGFFFSFTDQGVL